MKMLLALLLVSSSALASSCDGPAWDAFFSASPTTVEAGQSVHFEGIAISHRVDCGVLGSSFRDVYYDFGDGQSFTSQGLGTVDHAYAGGIYTAVLSITAGYTDWTVLWCLQGGACQPLTGPVSQTFSRSFQIVSHAPEPATYAMLLAGLGLIGFIRSKNGRAEGARNTKVL